MLQYNCSENYYIKVFYVMIVFILPFLQSKKKKKGSHRKIPPHSGGLEMKVRQRARLTSSGGKRKCYKN